MGAHANFHATFKAGAPKVRGEVESVEPLRAHGSTRIPTLRGDRCRIIQPFTRTIKIDDRYRRCLYKAREGERRDQESRSQQGYSQPLLVVPHLPYLVTAQATSSRQSLAPQAYAQPRPCHQLPVWRPAGCESGLADQV